MCYTQVCIVPEVRVYWSRFFLWISILILYTEYDEVDGQAEPSPKRAQKSTEEAGTGLSPAYLQLLGIIITHFVAG